MTTFTIIMAALLPFMCALGYYLATNNSLQGAPISRQFSCRLAYFSCATLIFCIVWLQSPTILVACAPLISVAGLGLLYIIIKVLCSPKRCDKKLTREQKDAMLLASVMISTCCSFSFGVSTGLCRWETAKSLLCISGVDVEISHGFLLASLTVLLIALLQYMVFLRRNPEDGEGTQETQKLLKQLHKSPTVQ